ncbi:hypothetical protein BH11CYA1_BH11CYA1_44070 [soil metagenome]
MILLNMFSFGKKAEEDPNLNLTKLPADTILLFGNRCNRGERLPGKQGLCDINGRILRPLCTGHIYFLKPGFAFVNSDGSKSLTINLTTWHEEQADLHYNPGIVPPARITHPGNYSSPMPFPKDRFLEKVSTDNGLFDPVYWREQRDHPIKYINMFNRFLYEHNLIGMAKSQLFALLGDRKVVRIAASNIETCSYSFPSYSCVGTSEGIRIYLTDDHVTSWSFFGIWSLDKVTESKRITTNVVLKGPKGAGKPVDGRLAASSNDPKYPEVQQKPSNLVGGN